MLAGYLGVMSRSCKKRGRDLVSRAFPFIYDSSRGEKKKRSRPDEPYVKGNTGNPVAHIPLVLTLAVLQAEADTLNVRIFLLFAIHGDY